MSISRARAAGPLGVAAIALGLAAPAGCLAAAALAAAAPPTIVVAIAASDHSAYQKAVQSASAAVTAALPDVRVVPMTLREDSEAIDADEIRSNSPALVLAIGSRAARLVHETAPEIHLVYAMVLDPASIGLPAPGSPASASATGISLDVSFEDQFALIRAVLPAARRVGVLYDPAISGAEVRRAEGIARSQGLKLVAQAVRTSAATLDAAELIAPSVDAVIAVADPTVLTAANTRPLILFWLRSRKPFFAMSEGFVRNGALAALVPDAESAGRRAGEIAAAVLKGTPLTAFKPEPPPLVSLFVNKASASHLGVTLPPEILARAKEVFAGD